jgi:origin recognition complex subunit 3
MSHYYANPLSILLSPTETLSNVIGGLQSEHLEAIRMLPSFRKEIEDLLDGEDTGQARDLLDSDAALLNEVRYSLEGRHGIIRKAQQAMRLLTTVRAREKGPMDQLELYVKAFSGQLAESETFRDFLASINTFSPNEVISLTEEILSELTRGEFPIISQSVIKAAENFFKEIFLIKEAVQSIALDADAAGTPIRSKYAMQSKILRTTVVAQKVQLSKEKSSLSEMDVSYSNLLDDLTAQLEEYFKLDNPLDMFLNEIWLYDLKSPNREVFTPKPRYAIERALSAPHDYLGCTCCRASEEGLSASQPPTAVIYQLYLETGGLINVFDLWSAFFAIVGGENGEDCDERTALVLFYRALADLKLLGMVKQSRKKTDHLAKLAWKGL